MARARDGRNRKPFLGGLDFAANGGEENRGERLRRLIFRRKEVAEKSLFVIR